MRQKLKIAEGNCKGQTELTDKEKKSYTVPTKMIPKEHFKKCCS